MCDVCKKYSSRLTKANCGACGQGKCGLGPRMPKPMKLIEADNPGARSDHGSGTGACMPRPDLIDHLGSRVVGNSCGESDKYLTWLGQLRSLNLFVIV
jgi:hypothetical protein